MSCRHPPPTRFLVIKGSVIHKSARGCRRRGNLQVGLRLSAKNGRFSGGTGSSALSAMVSFVC